MTEIHERYHEQRPFYLPKGPAVNHKSTYGEIDGKIIVYGGFLWEALVSYEGGGKLTLKPYELPGIVDRADRGLTKSDLFASCSEYQLNKVQGQRSRLAVDHSRSWDRASWDFTVVDPSSPHVPICLQHRRVWPCPQHVDDTDMQRSLNALERQSNTKFCPRCGGEVFVNRGEMSIEIAAGEGRAAAWYHGRSGKCRNAAYKRAEEVGHTLPDRSEWGVRPGDRYSAVSQPKKVDK